MLSVMKGRWWLLILAVVAIIISSLASYFSPLVIRTTIDSIIGDSPLDAPRWLLRFIEQMGGTSVLAQNLWICSLLTVFFAVINSIFAYVRGRTTATVGERIAEDLRNQMYDHIQHLDFSYHVEAETGDLLQRCSSDVEMVRRFIGMQLVEISRILISSALGIGIMISLSPKLTLFAVLMIPVLFLFSYKYFGNMQTVFTEIQESEAKLSTTIQESISGVRVVRAFGQQQQEMNKFDVTNTGFSNSIIKVNRLMGLFWGGTDIIIYLQMALVTTLSTYYVIVGNISIGTMVAFTSYVGMLLWPLRQLGRLLADFSRADVALGRINEVLNTPTEPTDGIVGTEPLYGDIVFDKVSFSYQKDHPVLKNVSFTAKEGKTIALLGATGSGKSSMMYLLQRLYNYDSGSITIGGTEITEYNRKWLRKNIGIVLQEPFLYSRNLQDNIAITNPNADEDTIKEASRVAALSSMISEFESGYETEVGERGVTLSGGQKQRVAIARTVLQKTPILIFDDSLSAVDTETDQMIRSELLKREHKATTFIISHRITTLSEADLILVLENGEIVQQGTHESLINQPGLYRRVWDIQGAEKDLAFAYNEQE